MMMCLIGVAVLIASTTVSGSFAARAGALKAKIDIANVSAAGSNFLTRLSGLAGTDSLLQGY
jgi:hypothetical protein